MADLLSTVPLPVKFSVMFSLLARLRAIRLASRSFLSSYTIILGPKHCLEELSLWTLLSEGNSMVSCSLLSISCDTEKLQFVSSVWNEYPVAAIKPVQSKSCNNASLLAFVQQIKGQRITNVDPKKWPCNLNRRKEKLRHALRISQI